MLLLYKYSILLSNFIPELLHLHQGIDIDIGCMFHSCDPSASIAHCGSAIGCIRYSIFAFSLAKAAFVFPQ